MDDKDRSPTEITAKNDQDKDNVAKSAPREEPQGEDRKSPPQYDSFMRIIRR